MKYIKRNLYIFTSIICILVFIFNSSFAQTTGKIVGSVIDESTGKGLPFANVLIEGTVRGAATDNNGDFFIINIPPNVYTLRVQMMGYEIVKMENVRVSVNRTTNVEIRLKPMAIEGQEVIVQADKITVKKDQTSSIRNVSSQEIEVLPVENVSEVISMQPGVVQGHFRGGRLNEVAYLIDGLKVTESFGGVGSTVDLEPQAIQDLEVITGTFNAEYGQAMSGIVNVVTKEGGPKIQGSFAAAFANFFTPHKDIFIGLKDSEIDRNKDFKVQLEGPFFSKKLTFFTNLRYQDNKNHLNGIRRFNVDDYSFFLEEDPELYYSEHNGDSSYVAMNRSKTLSFVGKLTAKVIKDIKLSLLYTLNDDEYHDYSHVYKYNPDGMGASYRKTNMLSAHLNHLLSSKLFYEIKLSYMDNYNGTYLYKNPLDPKYIHDVYHSSAGPSFFTGGQSKDHSERTMKDINGKFDLTWQINKHHNIKTGFNYSRHDLDNSSKQIRNLYEGLDIEGEFLVDEKTGKRTYPNYKPVIYPDSSRYSDIYDVKPFEYSGYIQDKIEYNEMVVNFGLRYDYFNPNTVYPSQRRNPANQSRETDPSRMSIYPKADPQVQLSPRFGLAYQLGSSALLHFSYGHFFQMPPMYSIYQNHSFLVVPTDYETTMGNAQIKAQKTVQYEVGLWQELTDGMGVEVALFYRDIYDLLSAKVISTYNQIEYGLYSNKDYGNVKGLEVKYNVDWNKLAFYINYTLQYTRGNADNPTYTFTRAGNSMDPVPRLIPMSWDQRHTLNTTVSYTGQNYNVTLTGYYNSGTPYTWSPIAESRLANVNLYSNNDWQPSQYNLDLTAYYKYKLISKLNIQFSLSIYNLLDRLNENGVNSQTGRAYTAIVRETDLQSHRSNFNDYYDVIQNPAMYSSPRMIKFGIGFTFE